MFYEILSANILTTYMKSQRLNMLQVVHNGFGNYFLREKTSDKTNALTYLEQHDHDILRTKFKLMYSEIINDTRKYMRTSSRLIWMCDRNATNEHGKFIVINYYVPIFRH